MSHSAAAPRSTASSSPDLAIIGSGSGNTLITPFWDDKRVMMVERDPQFGGTCLNYGCIPTKMYVRTAHAAAFPAHAARINVTQETTAVDWNGLRNRVFGRIDAISAGGKRYRADEQPHVELVEHTAQLVGGTSFTVDGRTVTPDHLVIAAGSRPALLNIPGEDLPGVHTSDTIMRLPEQPRRVAIIGGGFIASEFASIFAGIGSEVTQLIRGGQLMGGFDDEIRTIFTHQAETQWAIQRDVTVTEIVRTDDGIEVHVSPDSVAPVKADAVLVAIGRVPNTDRLRARDAGFDVHPDGRLAVDEFQRVLSGGEPVPGVWALGDISSPHRLKHVANHEARIVTHNLEHPDDLRASTGMPVVSAAFTNPEMARVGMTEAEARAVYGEDIAVKVQRYGDTAFGWANEDTFAAAKVVARRSSREILGADVVGENASILIQPVVMAMTFGIDALTAARGQYWPHPALSEVVENALLGLWD